MSKELFVRAEEVAGALGISKPYAYKLVREMNVAIHDPHPPGHNPHAHIMLTVRPLDEQGNWQYKTEKEYLCVKSQAENEKRQRKITAEK